jgi:DNA-binding protein YbaB
VTEPGLTQEQRQARVGELRQQADQAMAGLRAQLAAVKQAQERALRGGAEATSRDGAVKVTVDATGVVTGLVFAPSALASTPEKLAAATVATIQQAAAQARATMAAELGPVTAAGAEVLATARRTVPGLDGLVVPEVPRTAVDPGEQAGQFAAPPPGRGTFGLPEELAEQARATPHPPAANRPRARNDEPYDDEAGSVMREQSW